MAEDALVIFTPSGKRGRFALGTPVLTAARQLGVDLDSVCGGRGICSKCQIMPGYGAFSKHGVTVSADALSDWNAVEERYKSIRGLAEGRRLGCQARVMGDIVIDVPPESQLHRQVIRKSATMRDIVMDPATRAFYVEVAEPDMHEPTGDFERLSQALRDQWQVADVAADLAILRRLQPTLRQGAWKVTVAVHQGHHDAHPRILDIWPGFHEGGLYGLAIDLGSTTIAAHLCDLHDGAVLASSGVMNPQIRFGEDLMSRVSYAMMNPGGDVEMTRSVREALDRLIGALATEAGVETSAIYEIVFVCNPVMHHLLLGIDPVELGQAPFALATSGSLSLDARDLDLSNVSRAARVYVLPCIAGHVGADCAAVALSEQPDRSRDMVLIVDVGTNAELLLGVLEVGPVAVDLHVPVPLDLEHVVDHGVDLLAAAGPDVAGDGLAAHEDLRHLTILEQPAHLLADLEPLEAVAHVGHQVEGAVADAEGQARAEQVVPQRLADGELEVEAVRDLLRRHGTAPFPAA